MTQALTSARDIADDLLTRSGTSLLAGDFNAFQACFHLPQEMHTFDGLQVLETVEELNRVFDDVRALYLRESVTDVVRHIVEAEFRDEDCIQSVHESRILRGSELLSKPYPVLSVIRRIDDVWRVARADYAVADRPALSKLLGKCQVK